MQEVGVAFVTPFLWTNVQFEG